MNDLKGMGSSRLVLGCSRIGSLGNPTPLTEIRQMLRLALDVGIDVFDTADIYGQGDSERELGALLKREKKGVVVTKVGQLFSAKMRVLRPLKPLIGPLLAASKKAREAALAQRSRNVTFDFSRAHLRKAIEASLRRLAVERVGGVLLHSPDKATILRGEALQVLLDAKQRGEVQQVGVSVDDYEAFEAAVAMPGCQIVQLPLDVFDEGSASGLVELARRRCIALTVREVIRLQPDLPPASALAAAFGRPGIGQVVVGVSSRLHLRALTSALPSTAGFVNG